MLMRTYRKTCNTRCPNCVHLQPLFLLSFTFKPASHGFSANEWAMCPNCQAKLKFVPRYSLLVTAGLLWIGFVSFGLLLCLPLSFGFVALLEFMGNTAVLFLPLFLLVFAFGQAVWTRVYSPIYREVIAV